MQGGPLFSLLRRHIQLGLVMVIMMRQVVGFGKSQVLGRVFGAPSVRRSGLRALSTPAVRPKSTRFFNGREQREMRCCDTVGDCVCSDDHIVLSSDT
jgi:hypothetical protein